MTTLTASIAGFDFDNVLLNAAGVYCQTASELDQILEASGAGSLVTKVPHLPNETVTLGSVCC